ncbi:hypothetical protein ACP70R_046428 [Stipagrostis hirtigluma subsp. patula]
MASSVEGRRPAAAAAEDDKEKPAKKKTAVRRMSQAEIDRWIAFEHDEADIPGAEEEEPPKLSEALGPELMAKLPQHVRERLVELDAGREERVASRARLQQQLREEREEMVREREDILRQYREKGYVEYEVEVGDGDDEEGGAQAAPPRRGRRRFRPGVVKRAAGGVEKIN